MIWALSTVQHQFYDDRTPRSRSGFCFSLFFNPIPHIMSFNFVFIHFCSFTFLGFDFMCFVLFFTFTVLHGEAVSPLLVSISAMLYPFTLYTYFHLALLTINLSSHKKPQPQPCIAPHCIAGDRVAGVINNRVTVWSCNKERSRSGRRQNYKMKIVNWNVSGMTMEMGFFSNHQRCLKTCHC